LLEFSDGERPEESFGVFFSPDFRWTFGGSERDSTKRAISCRPIAGGLSEFFGEISEDAASGTPAPDR
jgi:hypothetical protein